MHVISIQWGYVHQKFRSLGLCPEAPCNDKKIAGKLRLFTPEMGYSVQVRNKPKDHPTADVGTV